VSIAYVAPFAASSERLTCRKDADSCDTSAVVPRSLACLNRAAIIVCKVAFLDSSKVTARDGCKAALFPMWTIIA
jgi:hypothetical protein